MVNGNERLAGPPIPISWMPPLEKIDKGQMLMHTYNWSWSWLLLGEPPWCLVCSRCGQRGPNPKDQQSHSIPAGDGELRSLKKEKHSWKMWNSHRFHHHGYPLLQVVPIEASSCIVDMVFLFYLENEYDRSDEWWYIKFKLIFFTHCLLNTSPQKRLNWYFLEQR